MKKQKISVISVVSLLLIVAFIFLFIQVSGKEKEGINGDTYLSQEEKGELENLMAQINRSLHDAHFGFVLDHAVFPNGNLEVIVKLGSENIDENTKEAIQQIATDIIKQSNFDSNLF